MTTENWKPRELEILQLLAQGLTNSEIGTRLHLSQETVRWYNKQIFGKLGAANRTQAVQQAFEQHLIPDQKRHGSSKPMEISPVRYVANDGVHIAYRVIGTGPVDLLFIHGFISNMELAFEEPEYAKFFEALGKFARVILFDKRGMGLSDRVVGAPSLEDTMGDALCVLDAVESDRTFVMGTSEGGAASVLLAATHPERVRGLILYASTPKLVQTAGEPEWADDEEAFERSLDRIREEWGGPWAIQSFCPSRAQDELFCAWWAKVLRSSTSPSEASAVLRVLRDIDIRPLLPQVRTRTLLMHKTHDHIVEVGAGRYIAAQMPNAKYMEFSGGDHFFFVESSRMVAEIVQFVQEDPNLLADTWIGITLYLHLPMVQRKENTIRIEMKEQRAKAIFFGTEEVVAVFDSPNRAIQCALKLRETLKNDALRISLHVGECNVTDGRPSPAVIEIARHAASLAPPEKVLITQTLRDILAGSGVVFDLRQVHIDAKKKDNVSVYAVK